MFALAASLFAVTTLVGVAVAALQAGPVRVGALAGTLGAGLASAVALALLRLTLNRGTRQLFAGLMGGMGCRMLTLAAALLVAHSLGGDLIAFAVGFFGVYLVHQVIEITLVAKRARTDRAEGKA